MEGLRRKLPSASAIFVFEAAARHGSFTRAASELNITQPAVSRTIALLERHIGAALFTRAKIGARLTEEGALLHAAVSAGFGRIEEALEALHHLQTGRRALTLSVSTAFTTHWLMPRIARFRMAFPKIDLRFQLIAGAVSGPRGNVDIALRYLPIQSADGLFVMHEAYVPVCAPGLADRPGSGRAALIELEGAAPNRLRDMVEGHVATMPDPLRLSDYAVVLQAALLGQGIAAGWLTVIGHWAREGQLVLAAPRLTRPGRVARLLVRADAGDTVLAVAAWLIAEMRADLDAMAARWPDLDLGGLMQEHDG
ncbi:MAG: LysR family transcriptional regulator [Paracoccus sp. (in: a-proteobacteria)]|uniref:LysR family transcriptional regulator n=1 Tax=Paracoccus sp. TaxID=267 RepID=UPI002E82CE64|nr:LysR family transcriptional regulator [Pseudomonadota bacterium]